MPKPVDCESPITSIFRACRGGEGRVLPPWRSNPRNCVIPVCVSLRLYSSTRCGPGARSWAIAKSCGASSGIISIAFQAPSSMRASQKLGAPSIHGSASSRSRTETAVPSKRARTRAPGHAARGPAGSVVSNRPTKSGAYGPPVSPPPPGGVGVPAAGESGVEGGGGEDVVAPGSVRAPRSFGASTEEHAGAAAPASMTRQNVTVVRRMVVGLCKRSADARRSRSGLKPASAGGRHCARQHMPRARRAPATLRTSNRGVLGDGPVDA